MNVTDAMKIVRVMNAQAAGATPVNSATVDMQNWESVVFIAQFGALTTGQVTSIKVQQGNQQDGSDAADLAGTLVGPLADSDGNKCLAVEVIRPQKRYVRCVVNRATANAVIDSVIAIQHGPRLAPTTLDSSMKAKEIHISPNEGTA